MSNVLETALQKVLTNETYRENLYTMFCGSALDLKECIDWLENYNHNIDAVMELRNKGYKYEYIKNNQAKLIFDMDKFQRNVGNYR